MKIVVFPMENQGFVKIRIFSKSLQEAPKWTQKFVDFEVENLKQSLKTDCGNHVVFYVVFGSNFREFREGLGCSLGLPGGPWGTLG